MLKLRSDQLKTIKTEALVIPVCEDKEIHTNTLITTIITKAKKLREFKGAKGDETQFFDFPNLKAARVILLGLGKLEKINDESLRAFAGSAVKAGVKKDLREILLTVPSAGKIDIKTDRVLKALLEGACLGNHVFDKYKKEKKHKPLKQIGFWVKPAVTKSMRGLPQEVAAVCEGTILAREWVSIPSNDKTPSKFAKAIIDRAKKAQLKVIEFNEKELKQKKFGAITAVGAGSRNRPRMVVLEYAPRGAGKTIALVGKGVTFDSGGINLKPTGSLDTMKMDMSGAAAVAATLLTAAKLKPRIKIVGIIPLVENMPSGSATRPGDIIKTFAGKTVEIGNTDAEGRLILIDAMAYAVKKYKPAAMIDLATLTGACVVALGEKIAGVFSTDDKLAEAIVSSGKKTHERCWHMPLPEDYKELIKSDFADLNNLAGTHWGGSITAALFLSEFVGDTRWAHIDIAGPAYVKKESKYCGVGGTGFGVRLLIDLLEKL